MEKGQGLGQFEIIILERYPKWRFGIVPGGIELLSESIEPMFFGNIGP